MALSRRGIEELAAKLMDGTITPAEQERLNRWLDGQLRRDRRELDTAFAANAEALRQRMLVRILDQTGWPVQSRVSRLRRWSWLSAAAAVLIAVSATAWFLRDTPDPEQPIELVADDILPGGNRAVLTLADGHTINLDEAQTGIVVGDGISYVDGSAVLSEPVNSQTHTLTVPQGGTYSITLPDGSGVWLNAGSTLTYPSRFADEERVVHLEGEAFFEIKEQRIKEQGHRTVAAQRLAPFKVVSNGQTVEVLGTEFNISAYAGEAEIKTTLVEGSIQVVNSQNNVVNRLSPGQQAIVSGASTLIQEVEVEQYIAWKEGYFYFDGFPPAVAFVQLSRWYDLDILYQGAPPAVKFFGMIERDKPLGSILRILEKSGISFAVTQVSGRNQLRVLSE